MDQSAQQVVIVFLFVLVSKCQQRSFYIKPSNSSYCFEESSQCYDLSTFISGKYWLSTPNTTLLFLPGEHSFELNLDVRNTEGFLMIPYILSDNNITAQIAIVCTNYGQTALFQNVSFVKIDSITFLSCGVDGSSYGALQLRSVHHSEVTNSNWYESRSSAIFIQNSNTIISDCQLVRNSCSNTDCSGGGIHAETSNVTFTRSNVVTENSVWVDGGGLSLVGCNVHLNGNLLVVGNIVYAFFIYAPSFNQGGGMYLRNGIFTATNTSFLLFERNFADNGGGLCFYNGSCFIAGTIVFKSNLAKVYGGGSNFINSQCYFSGFTVYYNNSCINANSYLTQNIKSNFPRTFGGGLSLMDGYLLVEEAYFAQNSAYYGGACAVLTGLLKTTSTMVLNKARLTNNFAENGGGISMHSSNIFTGYIEFSNNTATEGGGISAHISQCVFKSAAIFSGNKAKNSGGSLHLLAGSTITFLSVANISTSIAGWNGGGINVFDNSSLVMRGEVFIKDSHAHYGGAIAVYNSVLSMEENSEILSNSAEYGGAIHAMASSLYFIGNHSFKSNYAQFGGGFSLSDGSLMYLTTKMHIELISNYADKYGGAFWVEDIPFYTCNKAETPLRMCFYQGDEICSLISIEVNACIFNNNTAALAGSNIYGGNIFNCACKKKGVTNYKPFPKDKTYTLFSFVNESTNSSPISSDPMRVCLCTPYNEPDCSITNHTIEIFSGQQFPLTLVGVGQGNGMVPAIILSRTNPASNTTAKAAGSKCSTLFYTIDSNSSTVALMLYPETSCDSTSINILKIYLKIKPCPPGFMLHNRTKSCDCDNTMKKLNIQCDINSQSFARKSKVWVDYAPLNNHHKTIIYHSHCPSDYCVHGENNFTFSTTDNQCGYNRSGIICGACKEGYSLTLGGSKCSKCSYVYLLLFVPLAVAGAILVFYLLSFKITVAMGTINGLIFFANIIGTNPSIFIPPESTVVLRIFIAWLNLDLGINTCLFDGIDMYIKVWLQFAFPFYVLLLTGIIIVVSHYSTLFTKCLGSDPVAVLATLILLAYTKLFRAVLTVMSFTYIQSSDGFRVAVWLYDGNVRYLEGKHIPLFIFALLILLLLIIPYTMILLFAPYLQRHSNYRMLYWVDHLRLKPFLNSYYAPLKEKYRPWVGILLVLRLFLLILFVANFLGDPSINLFAIAAAMFFLLCWRVFVGTFYTNWYLDALELFFMMKLGLISLATLFVLNTNGNQRTLTDTLIGVAFTVFVAITVYHGWRQLTDSRWWRYKVKPEWQKIYNSMKKESLRPQEDNDQCEEPQARPQVPTTFINLRESLLESK